MAEQMRTLKLGGLAKNWRSVQYISTEQYLTELLKIELLFKWLSPPSLGAWGSPPTRCQWLAIGVPRYTLKCKSITESINQFTSSVLNQ